MRNGIDGPLDLPKPKKKVIPQMKKSLLLFGGLGVLLILVLAFVGSRWISVASNTSSAQSLKGTPSPTPCLSTAKMGMCRGHILVQNQPSLTSTPTASPTPIPSPTATPEPITPPTPTVNNEGGTSGGESGQEMQLAQQLFQQINRDRATAGLPAYTWSDALAQGASQHNVTMTTTGCGLAHQCPDEPAPCQRITNAGIAWTSCGENIGYASVYPDAWTAIQQIDSSMLAETPPNDGHRQNLLSTSFSQIGVAVLLDDQGRVWITEDFIGV